jgi:hypothetical protein
VRPRLVYQNDAFAEKESRDVGLLNSGDAGMAEACQRKADPFDPRQKCNQFNIKSLLRSHLLKEAGFSSASQQNAV